MQGVRDKANEGDVTAQALIERQMPANRERTLISLNNRQNDILPFVMKGLLRMARDGTFQSRKT
jgi:hypothetical protein